MDFVWKEEGDNSRMIERKGIADLDTHEPFGNELTLYFVKLPLLGKELKDIDNKKDLWIYCIKNLPNMTEIPL